MPHGDNNKKPISQIKVQSPLAEERLKIDWNVVDQLLMCHCSGAGIAAYLAYVQRLFTTDAKKNSTYILAIMPKKKNQRELFYFSGNNIS